MIPLSKASAIESPIWSRDCVPNWVHYSCTQLGKEIHIPALFLRPIRILRPEPGQGARQTATVKDWDQAGTKLSPFSGL